LERDLYELPEKHDFLAEDIPEEAKIIITNPPFSDKLKFLKKCYDSGRPFALLLPMQTLCHRATGELMMERGLRVIYISPSLKFKTKEGKVVGIPDVAWFIGNFGEDICPKGNHINFSVWVCERSYNRRRLVDLNQAGEVDTNDQEEEDEESEEEAEEELEEETEEDDLYVDVENAWTEENQTGFIHPDDPDYEYKTKIKSKILGCD
jgi:hypothetical protein